MMFYVLNEDNSISKESDSIKAWSSRRDIGKTEVGEYFVSTVFLVIDHSFNMDTDTPVLFETMVFDSEWGEVEGFTARCCTHEEAVAQHKRIVQRVSELYGGEITDVNEGD